MAVSCTDKLIDKIAEMVGVGVPPMVASKAHGVDESDFVEWMRKGQNNARGHGNYARFYEQVIKAEADSESTLVAQIRMSSKWQAAAWLLERRFPERYLRKSVSEPKPKPAPGFGADPFDAVDKVVPIQRAKR